MDRGDKEKPEQKGKVIYGITCVVPECEFTIPVMKGNLRDLYTEIEQHICEFHPEYVEDFNDGVLSAEDAKIEEAQGYAIPTAKRVKNTVTHDSDCDTRCAGKRNHHRKKSV